MMNLQSSSSSSASSSVSATFGASMRVQHPQNAGLYASPHPFAPVHNVNMLVPMHMNGMNMSMPVAMNVPMAGIGYSHSPINLYHPHANVFSHVHPQPQMQAVSGNAMSMVLDDEDKQPSVSSRASNRATHIRNLQSNGVIINENLSRGPQQSQVATFMPAKVVALATPALSTALTAPPTPTHSNNIPPAQTTTPSVSSTTCPPASTSSNSYASSVSNSPASSLPSTMAALEEYYYELLSPFLLHFRRTDSALVWLSRASPSSSFSLAVPRIFRNPKSSGGEGGYADAFKKLGLSLREKERKSGHFHLWFCDFRTVNLAALQTALKKRWTESENYNEKELEEFMIQANTKNKKENREEADDTVERKEKKDKEKEADSNGAFIDLSTIQNHASAAQSHAAAALNVNAKRLSMQQHLASKQKEKEKERVSKNNAPALAKALNPTTHTAANVQVAVPLSVPVSVMDMGRAVPALGIPMGMNMEEFYPNALHGYAPAVPSKEYPSANAAKDWAYDKEFESDGDNSAKGMDPAFHFPQSAKYASGPAGASYFPHPNYYMYHPTAHAAPMPAAHAHPMMARAANALPVHHVPGGGVAVHSIPLPHAYSELPMGNFSNVGASNSAAQGLHRQTSGSYFRAAHGAGFSEYEDERRLKRSHESSISNSKLTLEVQAPLKKLSTPVTSLPAASTPKSSASPAPSTPASAMKSLLTSSSTHALKLTATTQKHALSPLRSHGALPAKDKQMEECVEVLPDSDSGNANAMDEDMRTNDDAEVVGHLLQLKSMPNATESSVKSFIVKSAVSSTPQAPVEMMSG